MRKLKDERELLSKPGDTILETIEFLKMSQAELAERMGKQSSKIHDIISGKEPITVNTAIQLERVLGIDAQFWLSRESLYREKLTRIEQEEWLEQSKDWLKQQPVKELKKMGFVKSEKATDQVHECLQFYGVSSPEQWAAVYIDDYATTQFRKSEVHATALGSMAAWLRIGELKMREIDLPPFSKDDFKKALDPIKKLVLLHPEDFALQLKEICFGVGVALIYSLNFPKAPISGAARWIAGQPVIQLTDRYKSNDHFWFTFFHEAAHILLHGKKDVFIEEFEGVTNDDKKEAEANAFAANTLIQSDFVKEIDTDQIDELTIRKLARKYKTHPAIVLGRLQNLALVPKNFCNHLKLKVILDYVIK